MTNNFQSVIIFINVLLSELMSIKLPIILKITNKKPNLLLLNLIFLHDNANYVYHSYDYEYRITSFVDESFEILNKIGVNIL